jgi:hypothetical protein
MLVSWVISVSLGTRIPAWALSALPVNSSTHSRTTDVPVPSALLPVRARGVTEEAVDLAVVMISSF